MPETLDPFTRAYLQTALWAETHFTAEGDEPFDAFYSPEDIAPETLARMLADCRRFQTEHAATLESAIATGQVRSGPDFGPDGRAGHDFWLTRNGHGAGFWDGDWPEPFGEQLTEACKAFGSFDLYLGDDGLIYGS